MYSYLLTALLLWGFDRDRAGDRRWLIGLLVLFPLWGNLHGGCLVGADCSEHIGSSSVSVGSRIGICWRRDCR